MGKMPGCRIRLFLNLLVGIVNRREQITLVDAAKLFDLEEEYLIDYVSILVDHGMLSMKYPTDGGSKVIRKGDAIKDIISQKVLKEKVDAVLDAVKIEEIEEKNKAKKGAPAGCPGR
jgi:hypothetical protein